MSQKIACRRRNVVFSNEVTPLHCKKVIFFLHIWYVHVLSTIRLVKVHLLLKKWTSSYAALFLDCAQRCVLVNKILIKLIFLYRFIVYFLILPPDIDSKLWQYRLCSFQMGGTKLYFCLRINIPKGNF